MPFLTTPAELDRLRAMLGGPAELLTGLELNTLQRMSTGEAVAVERWGGALDRLRELGCFKDAGGGRATITDAGRAVLDRYNEAFGGRPRAAE